MTWKVPDVCGSCLHNSHELRSDFSPFFQVVLDYYLSLFGCHRVRMSFNSRGLRCPASRKTQVQLVSGSSTQAAGQGQHRQNGTKNLCWTRANSRHRCAVLTAP